MAIDRWHKGREMDEEGLFAEAKLTNCISEVKAPSLTKDRGTDDVKA
jgi:hypothetical protein